MTDQRDLFGERKGTTRSAVISDCRAYRYRLDRRWSKGTTIAWVMLNPSTADGDVDDATIRKISAYSKRWGHGALVVVNLFAYRSTHPKNLRSPAVEPVGGPAADRHIREALAASDTVVCAWGGSGPRDSGMRIAEVLRMVEHAEHEPMALGVTKHGEPKHPLYLPGALDLATLRSLRG